MRAFLPTRCTPGAAGAVGAAGSIRAISALDACGIHRGDGWRRALRVGAGLAWGSMSLVAQAFCFDQAGARFGLDPLLLKAVAQVESSMQARAINTSHFARTQSVDLGLMQINSSWLPQLARRGITREALLSDPCLNLNVGAEILARSFSKFGANWTGVGAYNAACTQLQGQQCLKARALYAGKVWRAMALYAGDSKLGRQGQGPVLQTPLASEPDTRMRVF